MSNTRRRVQIFVQPLARRDPLQQLARRNRLGFGRKDARRHRRLRLGEQHRAHILAARRRQRHQAVRAHAGRGLGSADPHRQRPPRDCRTEPEEMPALEVADRLGLPPLHPEQIRQRAPCRYRGKCAPSGNCSPRRRHSSPASRAAASPIAPARPRLRPRHIRFVIAPRLARRTIVGDVARDARREHLRLVDHHERGKPMLARRIEEGVEERRGAGHLRLDIERFEAEDDRRAMLADARAHRRDLALVIIAAVDRRHDCTHRRASRNRPRDRSRSAAPARRFPRGCGAKDATCPTPNCPGRADASPAAPATLMCTPCPVLSVPISMLVFTDAALSGGPAKDNRAGLRIARFCRATLPSGANGAKRTAWISTTSSAAISAPPTSRRSTPRRTPAGTERMRVDFGLETNPGRRFALWALMYMLGVAPDLDVAFKDEGEAQHGARFHGYGRSGGRELIWSVRKSTDSCPIHHRHSRSSWRPGSMTTVR